MNQRTLRSVDETGKEGEGVNAQAYLGLSVLLGSAANLYAVSHFLGLDVQWELVALGLNGAWWAASRSAQHGLTRTGTELER